MRKYYFETGILRILLFGGLSVFWVCETLAGDGDGKFAAFNGERGAAAYPMSALTLGSDEHLYGTSTEGGEFNQGTIFRLNEDLLSYSVIHSFKGPDGKSPRGTLRASANGWLYGTARRGGSVDAGVVFKVRADGSAFVTLHEFDGITGAFPGAGLVLSGDGRLFGTTVGGGNKNTNRSEGEGVLFTLRTDGSEYAVLHTFDSLKGEGINPQADLLLASDGLLYGTTYSGNTNKGATLFRIAANGSEFATIHTFEDSIVCYAGLVEVSKGVLLGATSPAPSLSSGGTAFRINNDGTRYAVVPDGFFWMRTEATLLVGPDGSAWGLNSAGYVVNFRLNASGDYIQIVKGTVPPRTVSGQMGGLALGADGRIYAACIEGPADSPKGSIFSFDPQNIEQRMHVPAANHSLATALSSEALLAVSRIAPTLDGSAYVYGRWQSEASRWEIRRILPSMDIDATFQMRPPIGGDLKNMTALSDGRLAVEYQVDPPFSKIYVFDLNGSVISRSDKIGPTGNSLVELSGTDRSPRIAYVEGFRYQPSVFDVQRGTSGRFGTFAGEMWSIWTAANGRLYGEYYELDHKILRLNADGSIDSTFSYSLRSTNQVDRLVELGDGTVLVLASGELHVLNADGSPRDIIKSVWVDQLFPGTSAQFAVLGDGALLRYELQCSRPGSCSYVAYYHSSLTNSPEPLMTFVFENGVSPVLESSCGFDWTYGTDPKGGYRVVRYSRPSPGKHSFGLPVFSTPLLQPVVESDALVSVWRYGDRTREATVQLGVELIAAEFQGEEQTVTIPVTFRAGQSEVAVKLPFIANNLPEGARLFRYSLSGSAENPVRGAASVSQVVFDDDPVDQPMLRLHTGAFAQIPYPGKIFSLLSISGPPGFYELQYSPDLVTWEQLLDSVEIPKGKSGTGGTFTSFGYYPPDTNTFVRMRRIPTEDSR